MPRRILYAADEPRAQPVSEIPSRSSRPIGGYSSRGVAQRLRQSSLWERRRRKLNLIFAMPSGTARLVGLVTKFAEDLGDRAIDQAIDAALDADEGALELLLDRIGSAQ